VLKDGFDQAWPKIQKDLNILVDIEIYYNFIKKYFSTISGIVFMGISIYRSIDNHQDELHEYFNSIVENINHWEDELLDMQNRPPMKIEIFLDCYNQYVIESKEAPSKSTIINWLTKLQIDISELEKYLDKKLYLEISSILK